MPAYQLHIAKPQEIQKEEQRRHELKEELDCCTNVNGALRNKIYPFLVNAGVEHLAEIDYSIRQQYKTYVRRNFLEKKWETMLNTLDRIKQSAMWEAQKTLAGKRKYTLRYEKALVFLKYLPDREIAEKYTFSREEDCLVWDFRIPGSEQMKQQIFRALCSISKEKEDSEERKILLSGLKYLYQFCIKTEITDIEKISLLEKQKFKEFISQSGNSEKYQKRMYGAVEWLQRHEFLAAKEIHWYTDIWYLERIHIAKARINESNPASRLIFEDVKNAKNRELLKEYIKYLLAVSDLSVSNIRNKNMYIRNFMEVLDEQEIAAAELTKNIFEIYTGRLFEKRLKPKSFNAELLAVIQFYNFLLVRGEIAHIPFRPNDYLQKEFDVHHDRCVEETVSREIIRKLRYFPEHLRLMYLHLWGIGLRASEVCTLKGNAYEWDGRDAWIQLWQPKMRRYKRVPIPEILYRLMMVYIKKYDIEAEDYLFPNTNGGAFRYGTLRSQMLQCCKENQISGGAYVFQSHDYRHNVATEFYDSGVPLSSVRDYHGHTYDEMTLQYIDHMPVRVEEASETVFKNQENNLASELLKEARHKD